MPSLTEWPPAYTLRRSRRARNVSLQIDPTKGLALIVPYCIDVSEALAFLDSKRAWIEKHADLLKKENVDNEANRFDLPSEISLKALEKSWTLRYHFLPKSKSIVLRSVNDRLVFTGNIANFKSCLPLIKRWIRQLAKREFPDWIHKVSSEIGLTHNKISIRAQKTLWGSCSPERNISLNDKLLFLPFEVVRYVFIHELCHTVYLNHSKRFWALVKQHEPNYQQYERGLRHAEQFIPKWFL